MTFVLLNYMSCFVQTYRTTTKPNKQETYLKVVHFKFELKTTSTLHSHNIYVKIFIPFSFLFQQIK